MREDTIQNPSHLESEPSRYERKRMEREQRERDRNRAARMKKLRSWSILILVIAALVGIIGFWIRSASQRAKEVKSHVQAETFPSEGQEHVANVQIEDYKTIPPTSGPHYAQQTNWGIHKEPVPEGYQVHNLEHGGVIMHYKPDAPADTVDKLKSIGESYKWSKIILHPYPALDRTIALTAWTRLDKFDTFDEERIRAFIDAYRNRGPENVPDNMASHELP